MPDPTPPQASPPSQAGSSAKPITPEQLNQELAGSSRPSLDPQPPAPEVPKTVFKEPREDTLRIGDDKGRLMERSLDGFGEKAREMMKKKQEAPATEKESDPEKVIEVKAKAPPKSDDKKAAPAVEKKEETPKKTEEEDVPEDQRKVLAHDKPETAKRIKHFLREIAKKDEAVAEARRELEEARKKPATAVNAEEYAELKKKFEEATQTAQILRRRVEIENDPDFKAKYVEPISRAEKSIADTLGKFVNQATMKAIADAGGFGPFSRSTQQFTVTEVDPGTGENVQVTRSAAELARSWMQAIPLDDAEFIKTAMGQQRLLSEEARVAKEKEAANFKEHYEKQEAAQRAAVEGRQAAERKAAEEYSNWLAETTSKTDWLKDVEIPANATPEQRQQIEETNEFNKQLRDGLGKHPSTPLEYGQMKLEAAEAHHLRRTVGALESEVAALKEQLSKAKGAMKTTGKGGSLLTSAGKSTKEPEPSDPTDFRSGLRARATALQSGTTED